MADTLHGKVAVVTGGSAGIGLAIAQRLHQLGADVTICGRDEQRLERAQQSVSANGERIHAVRCDVAKLADVEHLASAVQRDAGRVDILVNNAGVGAFSGPLHEMDPASWDAVMNTNLRGVFYCIRCFAHMMIRSGGTDIVNISSIAGKNPLPNGAAYSASKWGLNGLTYSVAEELRQYRIRVSVVCPGSVNTDLSPHEGRNTAKMLRSADVAHVVAMIVTQAPQSFASEIVLRPTQKP
jgi:3-oxoacyl-[acyl-carrier protein] reductase